MKIGIDAKWLYEGPISGKVSLEAYLNNLLSQEIDNQKISYYVILDSRDKISENVLRKIGYSNFIYVWGRISLISNVFFVDLACKKYNLDLIMYHNFGPFIFNITNYCLYVPDILFDDYPEFFSFKERIYFSFIKPSAKKAKKVITISESEKLRIVRNNYVSSNNVDFLYCGVDVNRFVSRDSLGINFLKDKFNISGDYIIYYGRLNNRKNIGNLISSFFKLEFPDLQLVIVGQPDALFTDLIASDPRIIVTGYLSDSELGTLLSNSLFLCFLSFAEGFGLPPLEAMSLGVPVLVSNATSLPEVCGDAAIYVDPKNVMDIKNKMELLVSDNELRERLVIQGHINVKRFSWLESAKKMNNLFLEIS